MRYSKSPINFIEALARIEEQSALADSERKFAVVNYANRISSTNQTRHEAIALTSGSYSRVIIDMGYRQGETVPKEMVAAFENAQADGKFNLA